LRRKEIRAAVPASEPPLVHQDDYDIPTPPDDIDNDDTKAPTTTIPPYHASTSHIMGDNNNNRKWRFAAAAANVQLWILVSCHHTSTGYRGLGGTERRVGNNGRRRGWRKTAHEEGDDDDLMKTKGDDEAKRMRLGLCSSAPGYFVRFIVFR